MAGAAMATVNTRIPTTIVFLMLPPLSKKVLPLSYGYVLPIIVLQDP
jgi:hypothetical protein